MQLLECEILTTAGGDSEHSRLPASRPCHATLVSLHSRDQRKPISSHNRMRRCKLALNFHETVVTGHAVVVCCATNRPSVGNLVESARDNARFASVSRTSSAWCRCPLPRRSASVNNSSETVTGTVASSIAVSPPNYSK